MEIAAGARRMEAARRQAQGRRRHAGAGGDHGRRQSRPRRSTCGTRCGPAARSASTPRRIACPASRRPRPCCGEIEELNADPAIHGILVQLPLPQQIDMRSGARAHLARQGRRRLQPVQRRRAGDRRHRVPALHALRRAVPARVQRHPDRRPERGGGRREQHRRQADGDDAACSRTRPSPSATTRRATSRSSRSSPTSWSSRPASRT